MSPDGRELWAANADDGTVSIIDIASKKVIATLTFPGTVLANRLRFTPDGKTVLISYLRSGELIAIDTVNQARDQMAARKLIAARMCPDPVKLADASLALKDCV